MRPSGEQNLFSLGVDLTSVMNKRNALKMAVTGCAGDFRVGEEINTFAAEDFFQFTGGVNIEFLKDVRTALNERDFDIET